MKTYNGKRRVERRKNRLITPLVYFSAELTLAWLILSIINISFKIILWTGWSYLVMFIVFFYSLGKTLKVYKRQKKLKIA